MDPRPDALRAYEACMALCDELRLQENAASKERAALSARTMASNGTPGAGAVLNLQNAGMSAATRAYGFAGRGRDLRMCAAELGVEPCVLQADAFPVDTYDYIGVSVARDDELRTMDTCRRWTRVGTATIHAIPRLRAYREWKISTFRLSGPVPAALYVCVLRDARYEYASAQPPADDDGPAYDVVVYQRVRAAAPPMDSQARACFLDAYVTWRSMYGLPLGGPMCRACIRPSGVRWYYTTEVASTREEKEQMLAENLSRAHRTFRELGFTQYVFEDAWDTHRQRVVGRVFHPPARAE